MNLDFGDVFSLKFAFCYMCNCWPDTLGQLMQWLVHRCLVSWCRSILSAPNISIMLWNAWGATSQHARNFSDCMLHDYWDYNATGLMSNAVALRILDVLTDLLPSTIFIRFCSVHQKSTCSVFMGEAFHMTDGCLCESDLLDNSTCYLVGCFCSSLGSPCWLMLMCRLSPDCTLALRPIDVPVAICLGTR